MITTKKHNRIVKELKEEYAKKHSELTQELKEAKDLKSIIEKFTQFSINGTSAISCGGIWNLELPDTVLQYTDDILGGKVIKQEGNKCLVIDKNGNVKTGLTKQKVDKGFNYKLVRE